MIRVFLVLFLSLSVLTARHIAFALHYYRCANHMAAGQWQEAIREADEALAWGNHDPNVYFLRGMAKADTGKYAEAVQNLDVVLRFYPNAWYAHDEIGKTLLRMGYLRDGLRHFMVSDSLRGGL